MPKKRLDAALYITELSIQYLVLNSVKPFCFSSEPGLSEGKQKKL